MRTITCHIPCKSKNDPHHFKYEIYTKNKLTELKFSTEFKKYKMSSFNCDKTCSEGQFCKSYCESRTVQSDDDGNSNSIMELDLTERPKSSILKQKYSGKKSEKRKNSQFSLAKKFLEEKLVLDYQHDNIETDDHREVVKNMMREVEKNDHNRSPQSGISRNSKETNKPEIAAMGEYFQEIAETKSTDSFYSYSNSDLDLDSDHNTRGNSVRFSNKLNTNSNQNQNQRRPSRVSQITHEMNTNEQKVPFKIGNRMSLTNRMRPGYGEGSMLVENGKEEASKETINENNSEKDELEKLESIRRRYSLKYQ